MSGAATARRENRRETSTHRVRSALVLLALACGCQGRIENTAGPGAAGNAGQGAAGQGAGQSPGQSGGGAIDPGPEGPARPPEEAGYGSEEGGLYDRPAPTPRLARLTHAQWQNSVRDLLDVEEEVDIFADFRPDPTQRGFIFTNNAGTLAVDDSLWIAYQRSTSEVVAGVFTDSANRARILPPATSSDDEARARTFIERFGKRAHRRPLTAEQVDAYLQLYRDGIGSYVGMTDFESGIRLVVEAFLQSPHFLYRVESSSEQRGAVIPLDGYEVAARLSYMLWDTMPDEALFAAADSGALVQAENVVTHAERMLDDPRAERVIRHFHEQLLELERYESIAPGAAFYPNAPQDLAELAATENRLFVQDVVYERGGSFRDLLTSTETFVNADLAPLYGLNGGSFGQAFVPVSLDATQRRGLLTQVGFLASNATSAYPDPIHRGVFVARRITCAPIGAPPGEIPPLPPPEGRTNRETIEDHTQKPNSVCASCHTTLINPFGFPFENYDSTGAYRTMDNGHVINASAAPLIDGAPHPVQNAIELATALAESTAAHECYAKHWLEFSYGRARHAADESLLTRLGTLSAEEDLSVKDIIVGLVNTESFLTRSTEATP